MKYGILFGLFFMLGFMPVRKTDALPTRLEITVRDELGNIVEGASVQLFKTQEDYDKSQHPLTAVMKTDAKGRVTFNDLEPKEYYVLAEKGDLDNSGAGIKTIPLVAKRTNKVTIIIS